MAVGVISNIVDIYQLYLIILFSSNCLINLLA